MSNPAANQKEVNIEIRIFSVFLFGLMGLCVSAQEIITGTISGPGGTPLPGVNVVQKSSSNGVSADFDGNYSITLDEGEKTLVFSSIGYQKIERAVGDATVIDLTMQEDTESLDEVVVVGYGTQKRVNLTGAVDVATSERIENRPIANAGEGLQGVVAGLNVTVPNGDPSQSPSFNIRGFTSINGGSPLILVDGAPVDINSINPEDIASVTVLKDGASAAVYGARAAFGVILVETKQGKSGKINVQLSTQFSWNDPIFNVDPIENGYIYALERNKAETRNGGEPEYNADYLQGLQTYWADPANNAPFEVVDGTFQNYANPNLAEGLLAVSPRQKYDLAISGASEKVNYYTSFGLFNNDGFWNHPGNDNFKRYNILAKADFKIKDWLTFETQITGNFENSDKPSGVNINTLIRIEPIRPYVVPLIPGYDQYEGEYWDHAFPIFGQLEKGGRTKNTEQDIWLRPALTLTPFKNLVIKSNFSYNSFNRQFESASIPFETISFDLEQDNPVQAIGINSGDDTINVIRDYNQYYVFNAFGEYTIDQLDDSYFKFLLGYNQEWGFNQRVSGNSGQLVSPDIVDIGATTGTRFIAGGKNQVALRGVFYRLNYIYKDKYLLESSARYDGTSRFPTDDRFGLFPSIALGWRISNEGFMKGTEGWLDNLKVRASYGELGNQLLGNNFYPYIPSLSVGNSNFILNSGQIPTVSPPGLVSPTLTWERVVSRNLGLDIAMFKNRLNLVADVYNRDTKNMLLRRSYPDILGAQPPQENGADLRTTGWDASLKWRDNISEDLSYFFNFNISDWTSEITKYDNPTGAIGPNPGSSSIFESDSNTFYEGQQIGEIWGYETIGIIQDEEQLANLPDQTQVGDNSSSFKVGDLEFADLNGDGVVNNGNNTLDDPGDRRIIGNTTPRYSYGINAGVQYKGFALDFFFQGVGKRDYYPGDENWTWFFPWRAYNGDKSWLTNSWTPDNRDAYFPEAQVGGDKNNVAQTRFLQDASYIRLKNLNISYTLPSDWMEPMGVSSLKLYLAGQNLWEYSKIRKPLDPEYILDSSINYPLQRTYTVGMVLNF